MRLLSILFLCSILSFSKSDYFENYYEEDSSMISNALTEKKLSMFPRNHMKFIAKPHERINKSDIHNEREKIRTRKPLMAKMVPRFKEASATEKAKTTRTVTRKPLMKVKTYTVKISKRKDNVEERRSRSRGKISIFDIDIKSKSRSKGKIENVALDKSRTKESNEIKKSKVFLTLPNLFDSEVFTKEEEQDRQEFIFLENNKNVVLNDMLDVNEENIDTTAITLVTRKLLRKRSSNIIEEENMGTTASSIKYTGQDSRLTNNLYFKNINH